jgi:hypothetical protein
VKVVPARADPAGQAQVAIVQYGPRLSTVVSPVRVSDSRPTVPAPGLSSTTVASMSTCPA